MRLCVVKDGFTRRPRLSSFSFMAVHWKRNCLPLGYRLDNKYRLPVCLGALDVVLIRLPSSNVEFTLDPELSVFAVALVKL